MQKASCVLLWNKPTFRIRKEGKLRVEGLIYCKGGEKWDLVLVTWNFNRVLFRVCSLRGLVPFHTCLLNPQSSDRSIHRIRRLDRALVLTSNYIVLPRQYPLIRPRDRLSFRLSEASRAFVCGVGAVEFIHNWVNHDSLLGDGEGTVGRYSDPVICAYEVSKLTIRCMSKTDLSQTSAAPTQQGRYHCPYPASP